jgi:hypothetical protein
MVKPILMNDTKFTDSGKEYFGTSTSAGGAALAQTTAANM